MSEEELVHRFKELPTGWITDALGRRKFAGASEGVYPLSRSAQRIAGRAVTVQYLPIRRSGPKVPNHYEIMRTIAQPGDVLVIAAAGTPCWLLGENQVHVAMYRSLAGICVDGCVRDVEEVAELPLPVFARGGGVRPYMSHLELTAFNVPVAFAGAQIRPGDIIVGDRDGLAIVPGDHAEDILLQTLEIAGIEKEMEEAIKRGGSLQEIARLSGRKKIPKER
jgi:4-hydroxy-4-methyl-2-oxoglutarate aldolase